MKTSRIILALLIVGLCAGTSVYAQQQFVNPLTPKKAKSVKKGDQSQGTFAYRFNTYQSYVNPQAECSAYSPECASNMNASLRAGATPFNSPVFGVRKPDATDSTAVVTKPEETTAEKPKQD